MKNSEVKTWITLANALVIVYFGSYILAGLLLAGIAGLLFHVLKAWRHGK